MGKLRLAGVSLAAILISTLTTLGVTSLTMGAKLEASLTSAQRAVIDDEAHGFGLGRLVAGMNGVHDGIAADEEGAAQEEGGRLRKG